jgi:predicted dienelactone hydrolase
VRLTAIVVALMASVLGTIGTGQISDRSDWPVGAMTRRFVPQRAYDWRGATTRALVTTIWYPADMNASMTDHYIGTSASPLFSLGQWDDDANLARGSFPLIVLSHGTGGSAQIMAWLARGLASHRYIVAAINHPGNNSLDKYTAEGFLLWWERARDLSTVIDLVLRDRELGTAVDRRRIGAAGFSLGGYTMFVIAGARTDPAAFQRFCVSPQAEGCTDPPEFPNLLIRWTELEATSAVFRDAVKQAGRSYRDDPVRAVFAIAPALGPALIRDSLGRIAIPVEIVAGADDQIAPIVSNAQLLARLTRATLTILPQVGHYTFLAACTEKGRIAEPQLCGDRAGVDREAIQQRTSDMAVRFFDSTLR